MQVFVAEKYFRIWYTVYTEEIYKWLWFFLLIQKHLVLFGGSFGDDVTDSALWIINPGKNL